MWWTILLSSLTAAIGNDNVIAPSILKTKSTIIRYPMVHRKPPRHQVRFNDKNPKSKAHSVKAKSSNNNANALQSTKISSPDEILSLCSIIESVSDRKFLRSSFIKKDGNCFYGAVSYLLYGNQDHHKEIRLNAMQVIRDNKDKFRGLFSHDTSEEASKSQLKEEDGVDRFIKLHSKDRVYAENECIMATAVLLGRPIHVYHWTEKNELKMFNYMPVKVTDATPIELNLQNTHYEILLEPQEQATSNSDAKSSVQNIQPLSAESISSNPENEEIERKGDSEPSPNENGGKQSDTFDSFYDLVLDLVSKKGTEIESHSDAKSVSESSLDFDISVSDGSDVDSLHKGEAKENLDAKTSSSIDSSLDFEVSALDEDSDIASIDDSRPQATFNILSNSDIVDGDSNIEFAESISLNTTDLDASSSVSMKETSENRWADPEYILTLCSIIESNSDRKFLRSSFIKKDGNCFYRAVSYLLYGNQDHHKEIRLNAMQVIRDNKDKFWGILSHDANVGPSKSQLNEEDDIDRFIKLHSTDRVYAENECIMATAVLLGRPIHVYHWTEKNELKMFNYMPVKVTDATPIELNLQNTHYEILLEPQEQATRNSDSQSSIQKSEFRSATSFLIHSIWMLTALVALFSILLSQIVLLLVFYGTLRLILLKRMGLFDPF